jgi:hypothetical protein
VCFCLSVHVGIIYANTSTYTVPPNRRWFLTRECMLTRGCGLCVCARAGQMKSGSFAFGGIKTGCHRRLASLTVT